MKAIQTHNCFCPHCKKEISFAVSSNSKTDLPKPGHFAFCQQCGTPLYFDEKIQLQEFSNELFNTLPPKAQVQFKKAQLEWAENKKKQN